jgi:hypothetical protein
MTTRIKPRKPVFWRNSLAIWGSHQKKRRTSERDVQSVLQQVNESSFNWGVEGEVGLFRHWSLQMPRRMQMHRPFVCAKQN